MSVSSVVLEHQQPLVLQCPHVDPLVDGDLRRAAVDILGKVLAYFAPSDADQAAATVLIFVLGSALGPAAQVSLNRRLSKNGADAWQLMADAMTRAAETATQLPRLRDRLDTTAAKE